MAHANTHTESVRIRTILEISAFNLATLEYELIRHGYIPDSTDEKEIRDATYRFYIASTTHPSHFYIVEGRSNIFDPYPYGEIPHHEPKESSGAQAAAVMAVRNERESVKYDAVTDLIRMLATRKAREGKPVGTATAAVKVEQAAVKVPEAQLAPDKVKIKALEDQLQMMRAAYAAVKVLARQGHADELRKIDHMRHSKLKQLALSPAAAEADEIAQQLADISLAKKLTSFDGQKVKSGALQGSRWAEPRENADDVSQEMSTATDNDENDNENEEQSEISSADAPKASRKKRIRYPRALVRARKAAMEMAAQMEDEAA